MSNSDEVLARIDHALDDPAVSGDAMRWTPEPAPTPMVFDEVFDEVQVLTGASLEAFVRATEDIGRNLRVEGRKLHRAAHWLWISAAADNEREAARRRRERARCRVCRPQDNPPPLMIDGHEFHRRRKTRRSRR